jgi:hypothetical protein
MDTRGDEVSDELNERNSSEWIKAALDTLEDRQYEYGDERHNLLRIFKICRILGIQLRDPADLALVFIATKLSRMVESPMREDSYLDLICYGSIYARTRFTDWSDFGAFEE